MSQQLYPTSDQATHQPTLFDAYPDIPGATWLAFTGDHPVTDAIKTFLARYGQPPPTYPRPGLGGLLLVGPVPGLEFCTEVQL